MSSGGISKLKLFFFAAIAVFLSLQTGCANLRGQQYHHLSTPTPIQGDQTLILGFLGGFERWNDESRGVRKLAIKLDAMNLPNVHVETLENSKRDLAIKFIQHAFDHNQNGFLDDWERDSARIILYGHSLGGAAVVKLSEELKKMDVPVLLTVQIDSVGFAYDDHIIPSNVKRAANLFQDDGWILQGEDRIEPENPNKTKVVANIRFGYRNKNVDMSSVTWKRRLFWNAHNKMDADPEVWATVGQLILSEIVDNTDEFFAGNKSLAATSTPSGKVASHQQERGPAQCLIAMKLVASGDCEENGVRP